MMNKIKKKRKITFPYVCEQSTVSITPSGFRGYCGYSSQVLEITGFFAHPRRGYFVDFFVEMDSSVDFPFAREAAEVFPKRKRLVNPEPSSMAFPPFAEKKH